jgi:hypothetical protein
MLKAAIIPAAKRNVHMPARPINPRIALKPKGWLKRSKAGTTPARPSGAVSITMVMVERLRTCRMMTISVAAIISGKTWTTATLAFSDSSMLPRRWSCLKRK